MQPQQDRNNPVKSSKSLQVRLGTAENRAGELDRLYMNAFGNRSSVAAITTSDAEAAFTALQQWYNSDAGTWMPSTGWWNSANCLTTIAHLAAIDGTVKSQAISLFQDVLTKAPQTNAGLTKRMDSNYLPISTYHTHRTIRQQNSGFLNQYYDDQGWWSMGWIAAYDVTGNGQYLETANTIFEDIHAAYNTTPCGGIWWDKAHTYVNAIANELFLAVAASLANRYPSKQQYFLQIAQDQWSWFKNSGLINADNNINDGLDMATCQNNGGIVWSYNQGVILGALVELNKATGDQSYLDTAAAIANAAIAKLAPNGILHDPCEPNCGADGSQFKGVFTRNLMVLQQKAPQGSYSQFLQANAESIWANDRDSNTNDLSLVWSGPFIQPANASTQSSALDTLVAALSI